MTGKITPQMTEPKLHPFPENRLAIEAHLCERLRAERDECAARAAAVRALLGERERLLDAALEMLATDNGRQTRQTAAA
ncbi:MAG TPA: hypothetical protein VFD58_18560 [Blastocatellia bacterium]|nr:hypothetical protein [Blastocatellia bacterium]